MHAPRHTNAHIPAYTSAQAGISPPTPGPGKHVHMWLSRWFTANSLCLPTRRSHRFPKYSCSNTCAARSRLEASGQPETLSLMPAPWLSPPVILESFLSPGDRTGKYSQAGFDLFPSPCVCSGHRLNLPALSWEPFRSQSRQTSAVDLTLTTLGCDL